MASLVFKQPKSPFWYYNLNTSTGRRRMSTKTEDKREAERIAAEKIRQEREAEVFGVLPEISMKAALIDIFLPLKVGMRSYPNLKRCCELLAGQVEGCKGLGAKTLFHKLTSLDLDKYRAERTGMGAKPNTIDREMACLSNAYNKLKTSYRMPLHFKVPMEREKGISRHLEPVEVQALLAHLDPLKPMLQKGTSYLIRPLAHVQRHRSDNHDLVLMLLSTGARLGEIASMSWKSVDTVNFAFVRLLRHKVKGRGNAFDVIAIGQQASAMLRRRFEEKEKGALYVFPNSNPGVNKGSVSRSTKAIRRAMDKVGINSPDNVTIFGRRDVRSLRDTFATTMHRNGMDLADIQNLLGHTTPVMTQKYVHTDVSRASKAAADILNNAPIITTTYRETTHDAV